jgi:predicted nucleotide-binding protein
VHGQRQIAIANDKIFLEQAIVHSDICEQGSVLVYSPPSNNLETDPGDLTLIDKATNANSLVKFHDKSFKANEGLAGLVFRKGAPEFAPKAIKHPDFVPVKDQNIGSIYCLPILSDGGQPPFGIVSFHNPVATAQELHEHRRLLMSIAVKTLEAMLAQAPIPLVPEERLFIVRGRDELFLQELESILKAEGINPVIVQTYARTGQDLLGFIENRIRGCVAGFVLLTPDDEGRLYQFGQPMRQRARQNVIFEGGYLTALFRRTNRICFLQQGDLEIPSDLNGLLMERFEDHIDRSRIILTLKEWGLKTDEAAKTQTSVAG